ncbi:polysaccharide/chitin/xylan deacetylase [Streptomyces monashensis]|uniref:Polysaccharide/chitin/xylan deacetylase n=1 Tax=Streptomyces monashensis TaxID=1678012 RepID=A0A1S2Q9S7_9ACTN|nr:polysaccharide/chitin/xylan deacetylase [Streptomyces monashensis]
MKRWMGRGTWYRPVTGMLAGTAAAVLTVGGCGASGDGSGHARLPAQRARPTGAPGSTAGSARTAAAWHRWGLTPLPDAPWPPADKPVKLTATGTVPVLTHVPTTQKVVFITIDDGQEKDPAFIEMMRDLNIPITMFLMNDAIKSDYAYFTSLQALGNHIQNHTLHHPVMSSAPLAHQKDEVCGDQKILTEEYGTAPLLFRPPYGAYDENTRTAVGECGPRAIVWWRESMQIRDMQYQDADNKLRAGDIILAHFRGPGELKGTTMTRMFGHLLRRIQEQGFAVARLEDYIQPPGRRQRAARSSSTALRAPFGP